jgi:hypothetical protein
MGLLYLLCLGVGFPSLNFETQLFEIAAWAVLEPRLELSNQWYCFARCLLRTLFRLEGHEDFRMLYFPTTSCKNVADARVSYARPTQMPSKAIERRKIHRL